MAFGTASFPFIPPIPASLRLLASLGDKQFELFVREINTADAFRRDQQRVEELRLKLNLRRTAEALGLLATAKFLYDRSREWTVSGQDVAEAIRSFFESTDIWSELGPNADAVFSRALVLVRPNAAAERERKRQWLRSGLLPNATEFSSFIDLRPNFTSERDEVEEFVPVVVFGIDTDSASGEEESFVFQLSPAGLRQLARVVDDARKKLDTLKNSYSDSMPILFEEEQSE